MEENVSIKGIWIVLTQVYNDSRTFIAYGLLFVGVLSIYKLGICTVTLVSIITGLLLLVSSFNGTRLKLYGRITSMIATIGLSYLGYMTDQYIIGLIIFYCAIVISLEVIRS